MPLVNMPLVNMLIGNYSIRFNVVIGLLLAGLWCMPSGQLQAQPSGNNPGLDSNSIDYAFPREFEIGATVINGIYTLDEASLVARAGLQPGKKITIPGDAITAAIKNLWKLRLFSSVDIYIDRMVGNTVFLRIETLELPRISKFSMRGIRKGDQDDIRERIEIVRGTPYKEHVKQNIVNQVNDYYSDKGFLSSTTEITVKKDTVGLNNIILNIAITKGPKVKIDQINIIGNANIPDATVRKKMSGTKEKFRFDPSRGVSNFSWHDLRPDSIVGALSNISWASAKELAGDRVRPNIFSSSKFNEDDFEVDKNLIIQYYNTKGYRDARIVRDSIYYLDEGTMAIDVEVDEGPAYFFRHITWSGNTKYSGKQFIGDEIGKLDTILNIKRGELYNAQRLEQKLQFDQNGLDITSLYMDDGYLFFTLTPVEVLVDGDSIDLEIRISEGPQATIRNVFIRGNTRTNEHVVRRELRTRPGDKFSRSDLIRTQRELSALGFFDPEQIGVNPIPNPADGTVDLEYTVVEKPSDQLELSAGWGGTGNGVVGSVGVSFNNFSLKNMFKGSEWTPLPQGDGQKLSFRLNTNGRIYQSYNMSFTEPWFGGKKPNSFSLSIFRTLLSNNAAKTIEDSLGTQIPNPFRQSFVTNGATVAYGVRLKWPDDFFSFLTSINLQNYKLTDWTRNDFFLTNGNLYNLSGKFVLARNSAGNNPFFPEHGSNIQLSLQLTPPYSLINGKDYTALNNRIDAITSEISNGELDIDDVVGLLDERQDITEDIFKFIEYHKWQFKAEWYTPLFSKFVLKTSAKMGWVGYYNSEIGHSRFEQFQLGGDGLSNFSIEGFDVISLRGYDPFTTANSSIASNEPIFNKFTMEMRYPISLNPSSTIYALAFAEGGNLYDSFENYNPFELKRSVGVGVRAFLPMFGLLGIDYGIRFDDGPANTVTRGGSVFDYILNNGSFNIILGFEPE
ncbi:MAG: outer membrane protein insertion porin family [Limisphaerales bacterium]|jgi:outer membrane protein insertion porin family